MRNRERFPTFCTRSKPGVPAAQHHVAQDHVGRELVDQGLGTLGIRGDAGTWMSGSAPRSAARASAMAG